MKSRSDLFVREVLNNPANIGTREAQLEAAHIMALTAFVRDMRCQSGLGRAIPYFDPNSGGVNAQVVFVLEAPGPKAVKSGFVSPDNPDGTAKNMAEFLWNSGIPRDRALVWNIVPWYIGDGRKIRPAGKDDIKQGVEHLRQLIGLLPRLKAVVLVGKKAQKGTADLVVDSPVRVFCSPHPSPQFVNRRPENRNLILSVFREVAGHLCD